MRMIYGILLFKLRMAEAVPSANNSITEPFSPDPLQK